MIKQSDVQTLIGASVRDRDGEKVGKVEQVYLDDLSGQPEWVSVKTGLFGTKQTFVPLADARVDGDELVVATSKDQVKDAPQVDEDGHLSPEQEAELYSYYGTGLGPDAVAAPVIGTDQVEAVEVVEIVEVVEVPAQRAESWVGDTPVEARYNEQDEPVQGVEGVEQTSSHGGDTLRDR